MSFHYQTYINHPNYGIKGYFMWRVKTTWKDYEVLAVDEIQLRNAGNFPLSSTMRINCKHVGHKTLWSRLHIRSTIFRLMITKMLMWFCNHDTSKIQEKIDKMKTQYFFAYTLKGKSIDISEIQFSIYEE
jgi:hypothetical protein